MRALVAAMLVGCATTPRPAVVDASVVFAPRAGGEPVDGHVRCAMSRANEITCALSHEGATTLQVCFHADVQCSNGAAASAEACRDTAPGSQVQTYHQVEGCDALASGTVTNAWIIER